MFYMNCKHITFILSMKNPYHPIEGQDAASSSYTNYAYDESYHQQVTVAETSFSKPEVTVSTSSR